MNTARTANQRKFERVDVQLLLNYSDGVNFYSDIIKDISIGGLQIETLRNLEKGKQLILTLPTVPPSKVTGEVVWSRKKGIRYNVGIKFIGLKLEQELQIKEIIRARAMDNVIL